MKFLRYFVVAGLILGAAGVASATKFQILDPSLPVESYAVDISAGVPFTLDFGTCPTVYSSSPFDAKGCAEAINESDVTFTSLDLTFTISPPINISLTCLSNAFTVSCSYDPSTGVYTLDFSTAGFSGCSGHQHNDGDDDYDDPVCGIAPGGQIWFLEDYSAPGSFPTTDGIANAPEPSSLWLALSSLGPLGYVVRRRRRNP